ncbi:MAG: ATP-dependent DNA helicase RecG [Deltaproteobacteria bacterium]|nr:ATP-dependent DNA helicase RecG [Deltaproteobacteria bacterium]
MTPLEDLLRTLGPPLQYLATAPPRLARSALPFRVLREKLALSVARTPDEATRARLEEVRGLLDGLAGGPLPPPAPASAVSGDAEASAALRRLMALVADLRAAPAAAPAPPRPYRGSSDAVAGQLQNLETPVQFVKGVGPKRAEQLATLGLTTVDDLLFHLPFRYEDRRDVRTISMLQSGEHATIEAEIRGVRERFAGRRRILEATAVDASGSLTLLWYHQIAYFRSRFHEGQRVLLHGKVEAAKGMARMLGLRVVHPEVELLEGQEDADTGRIVPIYTKPAGIPIGAMRRLVHAAVDQYAGRVPSALPTATAERRGVVDLAAALRAVHQPPPDADVDELNAGTSPAHRAIVYDELFYLQLGLALRKHNVVAERGIAFPVPAARTRALAATLPFAFTGAQRRVIGEIERDMAAPHPMHRLVQGDVGSGKTVVALHAAAIAVDAGYQAALMAPTELLAEQHCATLRRFGNPVGLTVALLTGGVQGKLRGRTERAIARGDIDLVVGTHALIQEGVAFKKLGLGIIDEQHRFGVLQRQMLKRHGTNPDILLMTATPIPRTLALTLYGDLEVSAIDELPPGRRPIVTRVFNQRRRESVLELLARELDQGRQAYLVYPLVSESEKTDLLDATRMARELAAGPLARYRVGLMHGQMRGDEKDAVMRRFRDGEYQVLVCTTVIEVGIDVPNATVMVIEHAEHFGLAQLHQLRGRVGRGEHRSLCFLLASYAQGDVARERLRVMEETNDGFRIAEKDLEIRGPGEFLGTRQSGLPDFRAANLVRDGALLRQAQEDAAGWLASDPGLASPASRSLRAVLEARWAGRLELARIG